MARGNPRGVLYRLFAASLALGACGRSQGVSDRDLGGLVVAPKQHAEPIELDLAAKDPAELGRALMLPEHAVVAALGPHATGISTATVVNEGGNQVDALDDHTTIELGDRGAFHAVYTNSADYGREATFTGGKLYLRPRYQRWHGRAPEQADEAEKLRDQFYEPIAATWDLLAPGAELTDRGGVQVAGRSGRKIEVKLAASPLAPPAEALVQRKWREQRSIDALSGEIVLDTEKGVPLSVKLAGTVGFSRDGRRFKMKLTLQSDVSAVGQAAAIAAPPSEEVVATPERLREVDDRDLLLQGIAPPLRKTPDGPTVAPATPAKPSDSVKPKTKAEGK
ncbi:MAG: hypothetical protein JWO36_4043 [Myxococcales bacterium]|nr:hypothetical protein [Myxococcales bacterium]